MRSVLQQALYDALTDALDVPVFDDVPQHQAMPYVAIGDDSIDADDTDDSRGGIAFVDFHIWSDYAGRKESKDIADAMYQALHQKNLSVYGYSVAVALWDSSDGADEGDGSVREVIETYKVILHE